MWRWLPARIEAGWTTVFLIAKMNMRSGPWRYTGKLQSVDRRNSFHDLENIRRYCCADRSSAHLRGDQAEYFPCPAFYDYPCPSRQNFRAHQQSALMGQLGTGR